MCCLCTGKLLTEYALQEGDTVYALARTPSKLHLPGVQPSKLGNLHIVQGALLDSQRRMDTYVRRAQASNVLSDAGDVLNQDAVDAVVSKADVVIETLGAQVNRPTSVKQVCDGLHGHMLMFVSCCVPLHLCADARMAQGPSS